MTAGADQTRSSGIEALIERLRQDGIARGQEQAARTVEEAETRARWILDQAEAEAASIREAARRDADRFAEASRQALEVATRDALLRLKSALTGLFHEELRRQVALELADPGLLRALIVELAGRLRPAVGESAEVQVLLPPRAVDLEELRLDPAALASGELTRLTRRIARDMLRDGVSLAVADDLDAGFRLRLQGNVELEFTDAAVAELLGMHLQPRFRAMLEGIVK
jgi:V/A-type H+-transporting ATPase subunit E